MVQSAETETALAMNATAAPSVAPAALSFTMLVTHPIFKTGGRNLRVGHGTVSRFRESKPEQVAQRLPAVAEPDLLALFRGARVVADRHVDDSAAAAQELRSHLGLELEAHRAQREALPQRRWKQLVARLHVLDPAPEDDVGRESEPPVAEGEHEAPKVCDREVARAED